MEQDEAKARVVMPDASQLRPVERARDAFMAVLMGREAGTPHFVMRRFLIGPGGGIPAHRHSDIEHEQVVVRGEMRLGLEDQEYLVRAGDAVFIPAGTTHWYENPAAVEAEFICVIPRTESYETEWIDDGADSAPPPTER